MAHNSHVGETMTTRSTLTTTQAAVRLGISHDLAAKLYDEGLLKGFRDTASGWRRIYVSSVEDFERARDEPSR